MKNPDESFEEACKRKKKGQQGKSAESKVRALLEERGAEGKLGFIRLLDARAAGKPVPAQPCDFIVFKHGAAWLLEVKQISKGNRLPKKSFPQLSRMLSMKAHAHLMLLVFLAETGEWWNMEVVAMDASAASWKVDENLGYKFSSLEEDF